MEEYKQINTEENYNKLLNSGMFWEFHPELTGMWEVDKKLILPVVSNCVCKIPEPRIKNSEDGINAYCGKCAKTFVANMFA